MNTSMIRGFLKIVVLKALAEGPKSGYSLMKFVEEKTGSKPSSGSMYPLLDSLKAEGLVSVKSVGRTNEYSLTADGKQKLRAIEAKRAEFTNSFVEGMKVLSAMTGENMSMPAGVVESIRKGEVPFKELNPEMEAFNSELCRILKKGLVKENAVRIKRIFANALKELKS
ncbi:MAG: PadR family transcriptional regulator [Candidatus Woesearchaeota archaeon]|nr:PadR family transcriptional regulator [Candidatus Woesearchaeota archaeon]